MRIMIIMKNDSFSILFFCFSLGWFWILIFCFCFLIFLIHLRAFRAGNLSEIDAISVIVANKYQPEFGDWKCHNLFFLTVQCVDLGQGSFLLVPPELYFAVIWKGWESWASVSLGLSSWSDSLKVLGIKGEAYQAFWQHHLEVTHPHPQQRILLLKARQGPAQIPGMGKQTPPLDARSKKELWPHWLCPG